jgi:predicted ATPase
MRFARNNFHVFTGGPGSGKTTLIETLRARGHICVDETARKIIRQQVKIDGDALHWKNQSLYRELILSWSIAAFESVEERTRPVFFDSGIPELLEYGTDIPAHVQHAADLFRYNAIVFIAPPWQEIYRTDDERKQDFAEAIDAHSATIAAYLKCGYFLVELPRVSPAKRADFVLERISRGAES